MQVSKFKEQVLGIVQHRNTGAAIIGLGLIGLCVATFTNITGNTLLTWCLIVLVGVGWWLQISNLKLISGFNKSLISAVVKGMKGEDFEPVKAIPGMPQTYLLAEDIKVAMDSLKQTNTLLSQVVNTLAEQASKVSSTAVLIAGQMNQQTSEASQISDLVERLQTVFSASSVAAEQTVEISTKSESEGSSGKLIMTQAMGSISELSDSVSAAGTMIDKLGGESKEIGAIISVIKGVAEQTK